MDHNTLQQTLDAIKASQKLPGNDPRFGDLLKASTFAQPGSAISGLNFYDLEIGAKFLYPVLTPLRNEIPRVSGKGGIQANWRAITAINSGGLRVGVSGGNRGGIMSIGTTDYTASYKGIGIESSVDFEGQYAAGGFDDVRAIAAKVGLESLMIGEEQMTLGGNNSIALGVTPTPTVVVSLTGGTVANNATGSLICVALTLDGFLNGSVSATGIQGAISRVNADASTDSFGGGSAQKSAAAGAIVSGGTGISSISAKVAAVNGAVGYAWYYGPAGSEKLAAITTINSVLITADPAGGNQLASALTAADNSTNSLAYDGLLTQAFKAGSNAYVAALAQGTAGTGTPLTSDSAGGIVEIDAALKSLWDNYRLSPDTIWVNSQEALNISKKILAGSSTAAQRFVFDSSRDSLGGGIMVRTYLNRFSMAGGSTLDIRVHPNMPAGTLLMTTKQLPYPLSNVGNLIQVRARQDYYQIEWPLTSRKYVYGVYADQVLQHYFPPSMAIITNIGNG